MKKGFTLVELLAVIAILGITITIVAIKIENNIKDANKFKDEQVIKLIEDAAYLYTEEYMNELNNLKEKKVDKITVSKLIEKGYIKQSDIRNINQTDKIMIAEINNLIKTRYIKQEKNAIFLVGKSEISININTDYEELGAYVAIINSGIVKLDDTNINSNVNPYSNGKYEVIYSYTNADSIKRIVNVI